MAHNYNVETSLEKVKRHTKYYLSGGDIHFLVENYIFRVHRYFFERESAHFREKFAVAAPPGQQPKGSSDATAIPLEDVLANDFSRFLWVFYNPKYSIYDATVDDWSAILKLAFDWRFAEVKKLCVRELEKFEIPALHKIELYQTYELDKKLLIPSYIAMCMRPEPLSIKEGRQLGLETALLLATARETARGKPSGSPGQLCSSPVTVENEDMIAIIKDVFGIIVSPPSPSLSPLENTASASASMTPATKGTNGITTSPKKLSLATPSRTAATTAVDSTFGLSSTPTLTAAAGKDATKSAGQSASTSSPTILNGRLNSVFAPMQGTVRPPPLEPPARAPSPVVQTPTVETPSVEISAAPTPAVETPVVQTPVLETPPVEKVEEEQPAKQMTKKEREREKKRRQQEKKAAQKKDGQPPVAGERNKTSENDSEPSGNSTSTTDVISTQSQSDAPTLVDITTSTPTIVQSEQSENPNETATITDKSEEALGASTGQAPDTSHQAPIPVDSSQDQQAESERKVEGAAEPGTPTVPASETSQLVDTSSTPLRDSAAGTTAGPSTEAQAEAGAETSESAAANEIVSTEAPVEDTALSQPELTDSTSADASVTAPAGGSDPASEGGEKTNSFVKEDKTASEGNNVGEGNVNDNKAEPAEVPAPAAASEAPAEGTSQTQPANGEAPAGEAASAVGDVKTTNAGTEAPAPSSSTDKPASPSTTRDEKPADATTSKPNAGGTKKTPTTPSQPTAPPKPNAWGAKKTSTTPNQPTAPKSSASGQSSSKTPTTPTQPGAAPTGSATESPRTTAPKPNAWGVNNKGSAATPTQPATTSSTANENKNAPPADSGKAAGATAGQTRTPTPKPTINTNVPNGWNKPPNTTPSRFATILAKVQGKAPSSASGTTAPAQSEDKNADHGAKDASPIPGAWQESNGSAPPESASGSAMPDQPPELAAQAQKAGENLTEWDFGEDHLE